MKNRYTCLFALLVSGILSVCLPGDAATPSTGTAQVLVTVQVDAPGPVIPADFMGLSYEATVLATGHFDPTNRVFLQLIRNLGGGVLRFGGNSVERTFWSRDPKAKFPGAEAVLRPGDIDRLFAFSRQAGWPVILGLNLGATVPEMASDEAAYAMETGREQLIAFEIGNEPELYRKNGTRKPEYVYADYRLELDVYRKALHARLPKLPLCGPAHASNFPWLTNFLHDAKSDVVMASRHHYPLSADPSMTATNERYCSVENLLKPVTMKKSADLIRLHQQAARQAGVPLRLGETSTASRGGKPGVSDSMAAALWAADYLFATAELGVAGVNLHSYFRCGGYTPICADNRGGYRAMPIYYGMLLFHQAARGRAMPVHCATAINMTAHAVLGDDGKLRIALINKDLTHSAAASLAAGKTFTKAGVFRLTAPSVTSRDGITLAGNAVAADGTWTAQPLTPLPVTHGTCEVAVPAASAALVVFEHETKEWP